MRADRLPLLEVTLPRLFGGNTGETPFSNRTDLQLKPRRPPTYSAHRDGRGTQRALLAKSGPMPALEASACIALKSYRARCQRDATASPIPRAAATADASTDSDKTEGRQEARRPEGPSAARWGQPQPYRGFESLPLR